MEEVTTRLIIVEKYDSDEFRKAVEEHIHNLKEANWSVKVTYQSEMIELYPDYNDRQCSANKYTAFIEYSATDKTERTYEFDEPLNDPYRYFR